MGNKYSYEVHVVRLFFQAIPPPYTPHSSQESLLSLQSDLAH